jgi:HlyD family secretion protein
MTPIRLATVLVLALNLSGCNTDRPPVLQGWVEADLIFVGPDEAGRIESLNVRQGDQVTLREKRATRL